MKPNVVMLFGVNGVGKTTISETLKARIPGSEIVYASKLLGKLFGGLTQKQLEQISAKEKMDLMVPAFIAAMENNNAEISIFDTHLLVPIRRGGELLVENIWSDEYRPYIKGTYLIVSTPEEIKQRREECLSTRTRDCDIEHIMQDQSMNFEAYNRIICPYLPSKVLWNRQGKLNETIAELQKDLVNNSTIEGSVFKEKIPITILRERGL